MRSIALKAAALAVAGLFGLAVTAPSVAIAADKPAPTKMHAAKKMKRLVPDQAVKALQEALNKNGAKLKVDGLMGGKTRAALKAYQKANGLKTTGKADKATKAKLGIS